MSGPGALRAALVPVIVVLLVAQAPASQVPDPEPQVARYPTPDVGVESLAERAAAQRAMRDRIGVPNDFGFTDRLPDSGIGFKHDIVEEGKKHWVPVHYDHGSPVVAADVDGDGLTDLFFANLIGANALYRNRGDGTFEEITARAGVGLADRVSMAASFADVDNDGDPDLYVTTIRGGNALFENLGGGEFRDVSADAGLDYVGYSQTGTFLDYDGDGLLDLFLTNVGRFTTDEPRPGGAFVGVPDAFQGHLRPERAERSILYRNVDDLRFIDVSGQVGLGDDSWVGDSSPTDFDRDGDPDLYLTNMQGDDRYWENQDGRLFRERTERHFPRTPWGTMGIKFFDHDNDSDLDLMLTDMHSDMSQEVGPERETDKSEMLWDDQILQGGDDNVFGNAFYRNLGEGRFEEVSDEIGTENYWPWGVSVADLNADGWLDAFITSGMGYPFRYGPNSALLNDRGDRFVDATFLLGIEPRRDGRTHVPWFILDCRPGGEDVDHQGCQGDAAGGLYEVHGTLSSRGSVILDLEGDGDLDIVTSEFNAEPQVLVSDLAQRHPVRFLQVELRGTRSNRDGLGSWVRVVAGERSWLRYHDGKSGYMGQSSLPLYFGLGDAEAVDRVEVTWPSGVTQTVTEDVEVGSTLEIVEEATDEALAGDPAVERTPERATIR